MTLQEVVEEAVRNEVLRQVKTEEDILRIAFEAGVESITVKWPSAIDLGSTMFTLPTTKWARRKLLRRLRRV